MEFFKNLKETAKYRLFDNRHDLICRPKNLKLDLEVMGFCDLFFSEDFPKVEKGLCKLFTEYSPKYKNRRLDIKDTFDNIYNSKLDKISYSNLGTLVFKGKGKAKKFDLLEHTDISLKYIAPSVIIISIIVKPSNIFIEKFNRLIKKKPQSHHEITKLHFKYGITGFSSVSDFKSRVIEIEELFLELNKSVVLLFREYFGVGLSGFGALPCIEVLKTNFSLKEIPKNSYSPNLSEKYNSCCKFFGTLGYPFDFYQDYIYQECDRWKIYPINRNEAFHESFKNYQIMISTSDFRHDLEMYGTEYRAIKYHMFDILALLAIEHFYKVFGSLILDLKLKLEPQLSNQLGNKAKLKSLNSAFLTINLINSLYFKQSRIWSNTNQDFIFRCIANEAYNLSRHSKNNNTELLVDNIKNSIINSKLNCEDKLNSIRLSYEQFLTYKSTYATYKLGKITLIFSIIVTIFTFLTLIPEKIRIDCVTYIWKIVSSIFQFN